MSADVWWRHSGRPEALENATDITAARKRRKSVHKVVREDVLVSQLTEQLQAISLCDRYTNWMLEEVDSWQKDTENRSQSRAGQLAEDIKAAEVRFEKLVSLYLDEEIPRG